MWNNEEDKILLELYEKYGPNWQNISFYLKNRSGTIIMISERQTSKRQYSQS